MQHSHSDLKVVIPNLTGDVGRKRKEHTAEMYEIVNFFFFFFSETPNIIPFQMAVRVQICSVL